MNSVKSKKAFLIFIVCYASYASIYIGRLNLSIASPALTETKILDLAQVGMLGSVFSVVYAIGRLINGGISDKLPPWIMISGGLIISALSNITLGFLPPFFGMLFLWGANAYAQSMLWSSLLCVISAVYSKNDAKKKTSLLVTSVAVGNILAIIVNTFIINQYGVRFAFIVPGGITLICGALIFFSTQKIKPLQAAHDEHIPLLKLLTHRETRYLIVPAMLHGVIKDNISFWMAVYFVDTFKINLAQSSYFVFFIPFIGLIGRTFYPLCYKLCAEQEHKVSFWFFLLCAVSSIPLCVSGIISPSISVICLSLIYASVSLINTSILSIFPMNFLHTGNVASVSGIMDFVTYLGAGISSLIYGFIIKYAGYTPMFCSWFVISIISAIVLFILTKPPAQKHKPL